MFLLEMVETFLFIISLLISDIINSTKKAKEKIMKKSLTFLIIPTMLISSCALTQRCSALFDKLFHRNNRLKKHGKNLEVS